jgi:hydroxypyruvate reductase
MSARLPVSPTALLWELFDAAVAAVSAERCVPPYLPPPPLGSTVVVGAGKAAAAMAATVEKHWRGPLSGLVVTRYGHGVPTQAIEVMEAAHPVPDNAGALAAQRVVDLVRSLTARDLLLCLISGGGSSLLTAPAVGLSLQEKQAINRALLRSGANIAEMNCVRKHLSAIKGGRLAAACQAHVETLLISDIPGDDPSLVASGPTIADPSTCRDALEVIDRYDIPVSATIRDALKNNLLETPKPGDIRLASHRHHVVATAGDALRAAASKAREMGINAIVLSDSIEGEAREVARQHAIAVKDRLAAQGDACRPCIILSGGESTVTVRGNGRGGRNAEFLLALALELDGMRDVYAIACDTDGIDGSEDNAGAVLTPDSMARAQALGLDGAAMLANNDGYGFFNALGDLVVTGPTRTNVNDFRAILLC